MIRIQHSALQTLSCGLLLCSLVTACSSGGSDGGGDDTAVPAGSSRVAGVLVAEKSADKDFLAAWSWCGFAPEDGATWVYDCQDAQGADKPGGDRAMAFGYHAEPTVGLDLLFVRRYTAMGTLAGYVWSPSNDIGTAFAADGGLYTVGVSDGLGGFTVLSEAEPFIPGEIGSVGDTWGTVSTPSGNPPVETFTWRYRLEATGVSLSLPLDGGTTASDCYRITNNNTGEIEYYSPTVGGLVAVEESDGDLLLLSSRGTGNPLGAFPPDGDS